MRTPVHCLIAAAGLGLAAIGASADTTTVLHFEDLAASGPYGSPMPSGYGGIDWQGGNWIYLTCDVVAPCPGYIGPGDYYPYQAHSYPNMVSVDFSSGTSMQFGFKGGGPAVFNGAWVSTWDNDYFGYVLKLGGNVVYSSPLAHTGSVPTFVASGYGGQVDQVVIIASDIGDWAVDDLSFTTSPVPEPASGGLMLGGLAVMLARRARRRC